MTKGISEMWVISLRSHDVPEAAGRPLRHEHGGGADAEHREERPALRVDVEEGQVDRVAVVGPRSMLRGPMRLAQIALAWVWTTALGLLSCPR